MTEQDDEELDYCDVCGEVIQEGDEYDIINKCVILHSRCRNEDIDAIVGPQPPARAPT